MEAFFTINNVFSFKRQFPSIALFLGINIPILSKILNRLRMPQSESSTHDRKALKISKLPTSVYIEPPGVWSRRSFPSSDPDSKYDVLFESPTVKHASPGHFGAVGVRAVFCPVLQIRKLRPSIGKGFGPERTTVYWRRSLELGSLNPK